MDLYFARRGVGEFHGTVEALGQSGGSEGLQAGHALLHRLTYINPLHAPNQVVDMLDHATTSKSIFISVWHFFLLEYSADKCMKNKRTNKDKRKSK